MISNFPTRPHRNLGGYVSFQFISILGVDIYPEVVDGVASAPITLRDGYSWLTGYATYGSLSFQEKMDSNIHGPLYLPVVAGFAPGDKPDQVALMEQMDGHQFLVKLRDTKGVLRVIGPVEFSADFNGGAARSDAKGFGFKFTGETVKRAPKVPA